MGYQLSPDIEIREFDLTSSVPAVSTSMAATAGVFKWGPVEDPTLISSQEELEAKFYKSTDDNYETYINAENFLGYGNRLLVCRALTRHVAANGTVFTAQNATSGANTALIKNYEHYQGLTATELPDEWYAKYPGDVGNSLRVAVCVNANQFSSTLGSTSTTANTFTVASNANTMTVVASDDTVALNMANAISVGDLIKVTAGSVAKLLKVASVTDPAASSNTFSVTFTSKNTTGLAFSSHAVERRWEFSNVIKVAPSNVRASNTSVVDGMHIVVVDEDGLFSGVRGTVLETYTNASRATDAKGESGGSLYFKNLINTNSRYIWVGGGLSWAAPNPASSVTNISTLPTNVSWSLTDGSDDATDGSGTTEGTETGISLASLYAAFDKFKDSSLYDISFIFAGKSVNRGSGEVGESLPNYLTQNIAEVRRDIMVFASPSAEAVLGQEINLDAVEDIQAFRSAIVSSSYLFIDGNYKYQYDRHNDVYRWVPFNGDIAGLAARTHALRDPWYSFAGFNRGVIKNVTKLAFNPDKADRDELYQVQVNPIVAFPGEGTVLMGDRTTWTDASAFQYANVRSLFITLQKAIKKSAKRMLFEFNNSTTRSGFVNRVEPYLREVQGRNGIYDFKVVCDASNNTGEVIDRGEFVGAIYVKPARSINFIRLDFVAVKTDVEFAEIIGVY